MGLSPRNAVAVAALVVVCVVVSATGAHASEGDEDPYFRTCTYQCQVGCDAPGAPPLSWELRLMWWTCRDDCNYQCMHKRNDARVAAGQPVWKYFGKWPFRRVLGMQELFSVLFSVGNAVPHIVMGFGRYRREVSAKYPYRNWWLAYAGVACNTWLWSAVFHARDLRPTERLDYYCASILIVFSAAVSLIRILRLRQTRHFLLVLVPLLLLLLNHIRYLQFVHFDYGYNMQASAVVGVSYALLWIVWSFRNQNAARPYAWKAGTAAGCMILFAALEIGDFPPFFELLDAHAMWHGLTIPLGFLFWSFLREDARVHVDIGHDDIARHQF